MFSIDRILVPTDFSSHSDMALQKAVDIASQFNAKIYLLHVIDDHLFEYGSDVGLGMEENKTIIIGETTAYCKDLMKKQVASMIDAKGTVVDIGVLTGNPAEAILAEEKERKIDLIVIGAHGRTGIIHQLLGGVADKVVRRATSPVFVVK